MAGTGAVLLEIFLRGNDILQKDLFELEEMTYSPAVNVRDFSTSFKKIVEYWDKHEGMEEKILEVLGEEGYRADVDKIMFDKGELKETKKGVLEAIRLGEDEAVKKVIKEEIGTLIDLLKAHIFAVDDFFAGIAWDELREESLTKIRLLQIIPSDEVLKEDWRAK